MTNIEQFRKIAQELGDLYEKKNLAYGNSFSETYNKLGLISAVTRISDKFNRLCNLATNPNIDNLGESLEDTLRDMASYCIMTVMELENKKPLKHATNSDITNGAISPYNPDLTIHKGDSFECKKDVFVDDGEIAYRVGCIYYSDNNCCITDDYGDKIHVWCVKDNWKEYFKRM